MKTIFATTIVALFGLKRADACNEIGCEMLAEELDMNFKTVHAIAGAPAGCVRFKNKGLIWVKTCANEEDCDPDTCERCKLVTQQCAKMTYVFNDGAFCVDGYSPITKSSEHCKKAALALGLSARSVKDVDTDFPWGTSRPQGCFRDGSNNKMYFNRAEGGNALDGDRILCEVDGAVVDTPAPTPRPTPAPKPEKLKENDHCWPAGSTMPERDAACEGDLVCARTGFDGRMWGGCTHADKPGPPFYRHCCTKVPEYTYTLRGKLGTEQVKINGQTINLAKTETEFGSKSQVVKVEFLNDANTSEGNRDVFFTSTDPARIEAAGGLVLNHWKGDWKCKTKDENVRCNLVRDGNLAWNGVYGITLEHLPEHPFKKCPAGFRTMPDTDFHGNDIACGKGLSLEEAQKACLEDSECLGFSVLTKTIFPAMRHGGKLHQPWCLKKVVETPVRRTDHSFCVKENKCFAEKLGMMAEKLPTRYHNLQAAQRACVANGLKCNGILEDGSSWYIGQGLLLGSYKVYEKVSCEMQTASTPRPCAKKSTTWKWDGETPDFDPNCGFLPATTHGCDRPWMQENCAKTCGTCKQQPTLTQIAEGERGSNHCPAGYQPIESQGACASAANALKPSAISRSMVAGSWAHVSPFCSYQSGGDNSPHYNSNKGGKNDGGYSPICEKDDDDCFIGCFVDDNNRDFEKYLGRGHDVNKCRRKCADLRYTYFAVQHLDQCFCGNRFSTAPAYKRVGNHECDRGSQRQSRGGAWRNSVYKVTCSKVNLGACMSIEKNRDFPGNDLNAGGKYGRIKGHLPNAEACRAACARTAGCKSWTFVKSEPAGQDNCAVKRTTKAQGRNNAGSCCDSGELCAASARRRVEQQENGSVARRLLATSEEPFSL